MDGELWKQLRGRDSFLCRRGAGGAELPAGQKSRWPSATCSVPRNWSVSDAPAGWHRY